MQLKSDIISLDISQKKFRDICHQNIKKQCYDTTIKKGSFTAPIFYLVYRPFPVSVYLLSAVQMLGNRNFEVAFHSV